MIDTYGIDAVRLFVLSDTPPEKDFEWSDEGLEGAWRYLNRLWRVLEAVTEHKNRVGQDEESLKLRKIAHQSIVKFDKGYEANGFNKVIAFARELTRDLEEATSNPAVSGSALTEAAQILMMALNPMIPHLTSDIWQQLTGAILSDASWPTVDPDLAAQTEITIAVQVNGKMRGSFEVAADSDQDVLLNLAQELATVQRDLDGKNYSQNNCRAESNCEHCRKLTRVGRGKR